MFARNLAEDKPYLQVFHEATAEFAKRQEEMSKDSGQSVQLQILSDYGSSFLGLLDSGKSQIKGLFSNVTKKQQDRSSDLPKDEKDDDDSFEIQIQKASKVDKPKKEKKELVRQVSVNMAIKQALEQKLKRPNGAAFAPKVKKTRITNPLDLATAIESGQENVPSGLLSNQAMEEVQYYNLA
jgi:hypothetical protein